MKQRFFFVAIIFFSSIMAIFLINIASAKTNKHKNHFLRRLSAQPIVLLKVKDIYYNSYYFAGINRQGVFLGNYTSPLHIFTLDTLLNTEQYKTIKTNKVIIKGNTELKVDTSNFYLNDKTQNAILSGNIHSLQTTIYSPDAIFYSSFEPVSTNSLMLRIIDKRKSQYVLAKKTISPQHLQIVHEILEKQIDGLFCEDGVIQYDPVSSIIIYIYYYRNEFISLDTNLNLLNRFHTIDTISHAQITVARVSGGNALTMASPPLMVNKKICVYNNLLYNNSNLIADNENLHTFNHVSVIDVYNIQNGVYRNSFYLPDRGDMKIKSFRVFGNFLYVIYDHFLYLYKL